MSEREPESEKQPDQRKAEDSEGGDLEKIAPELANLPPEIKKVVQATLSMQRISTPFVSPIVEKVNESHISKGSSVQKLISFTNLCNAKTIAKKLKD